MAKNKELPKEETVLELLEKHTDPRYKEKYVHFDDLRRDLVARYGVEIY